MHVQGRAVRSDRQGTTGDDENDLSLGIAYAPHLQDLSSTAVFQPQSIHDSSSLRFVDENNLRNLSGGTNWARLSISRRYWRS